MSCFCWKSGEWDKHTSNYLFCGFKQYIWFMICFEVHYDRNLSQSPSDHFNFPNKQYVSIPKTVGCLMRERGCSCCDIRSHIVYLFHILSSFGCTNALVTFVVNNTSSTCIYGNCNLIQKLTESNHKHIWFAYKWAIVIRARILLSYSTCLHIIKRYWNYGKFASAYGSDAL